MSLRSHRIHFVLTKSARGKKMRVNLFKLERRVFRMQFYAWDAARNKRVHVYIEKTMEKQRNQIKKTTAVCLTDSKLRFNVFLQLIIVYWCYTFSHFELPWLENLLKHFPRIISEHKIHIRQVCTRCSCSSCIISAKLFNKWFVHHVDNVWYTWNIIFFN